MDHVKTQITVTPLLGYEEASRVVAMTALCVSIQGIQPYDSCASLEQSNRMCQWFL